MNKEKNKIKRFFFFLFNKSNVDILLAICKNLNHQDICNLASTCKMAHDTLNENIKSRKEIPIVFQTKKYFGSNAAINDECSICNDNGTYFNTKIIIQPFIFGESLTCAKRKCKQVQRRRTLENALESYKIAKKWKRGVDTTIRDSRIRILRKLSEKPFIHFSDYRFALFTLNYFCEGTDIYYEI